MENSDRGKRRRSRRIGTLQIFVRIDNKNGNIRGYHGCFLMSHFSKNHGFYGEWGRVGGSNSSRATIFGKDSVRRPPLAPGRGGRKSHTSVHFQRDNSKDGNRSYFRHAVTSLERTFSRGGASGQTDGHRLFWSAGNQWMITPPGASCAVARGSAGRAGLQSRHRLHQ